MAVQLKIDYEQLVRLVKQLSDAQQNALIAELLNERAQHPLNAEEKIQRLDAAKLHNAVNEEMSIRRVDWYGDDGR
jgi:hypothetical protein